MLMLKYHIKPNQLHTFTPIRARVLILGEYWIVCGGIWCSVLRFNLLSFFSLLFEMKELAICNRQAKIYFQRLILISYFCCIEQLSQSVFIIWLCVARPFQHSLTFIDLFTANAPANLYKIFHFCQSIWVLKAWHLMEYWNALLKDTFYWIYLMDISGRAK